MIEKIPVFFIFTPLFFLLFLLLADLCEGYKERIQSLLKRIHWNTVIKTFCVWIVILLLRKLMYYISFTGVIQAKDALFLVDERYLIFIFFSISWIVATPLIIFRKKAPAHRQVYLLWVAAFMFIVISAADKMQGKIEFPEVLLLVMVKSPLLFLKMLSSGKYLGPLTGLAAAYGIIYLYDKIKAKKIKLKVKSFIVPGVIFVSILLMGFFRFTGNFEEKVIHRIQAAESTRAFEDLIAAAGTIKDENRKSDTVKEIAVAIAKTGKKKWAFSIAESIEAEMVRWDALEDIRRINNE